MTKHSCDESCQCCVRCFQASRYEVCDQLCKHSTPETTLREQIEQLQFENGDYDTTPTNIAIVTGYNRAIADVLHVLTERPAETPCDHAYERQVCEQCAKCGNLRGCIQPTHWRPLPAAPAKEDK